MICPIIGTGSIEDPYRASVQTLATVNASAIIPSKPDGSPKFNFALAIVAAVNWQPVLAITNSFVFPDFALDSQMNSMEVVTRTGMEQSLEAFDLDGAGLHFDAGHNGTDSYRHFIEAIARQIDPGFNIDSFGVGEVAVVIP